MIQQFPLWVYSQMKTGPLSYLYSHVDCSIFNNCQDGNNLSVCQQMSE